MAISDVMRGVQPFPNMDTLSRLTHVDAVGNRELSEPASRIENFGFNSLKPSKGGLAQLVTKRRNAHLCA